MNDYIELLRGFSLFFKLESKTKFRKAVTLQDAIRTLKSIDDSYKAFVESEYFKLNTQNETSKYNKIINALNEENQLLIVDLKFESLGMEVAPDTINTKHTIPNIQNQIEWKKNTYSQFLSTVIKSNYEDEVFLEEVKNRFSENQRYKIFNPIINGIILNNDSNFFYATNKSSLKRISDVSEISIKTLTPSISKKKIIQEEIEPKTSLALVEIKGDKIKPKVLQLFENIEKPIVRIDDIILDSKEYELFHPIYCEMEISTDGVLLQNEEIGIFAFGDSLENAKSEFSIEFDFIYNRYNSIEDSNLTSDVLKIKRFLNIIVSNNGSN